MKNIKQILPRKITGYRKGQVSDYELGYTRGYNVSRQHCIEALTEQNICIMPTEKQIAKAISCNPGIVCLRKNCDCDICRAEAIIKLLGGKQ